MVFRWGGLLCLDSGRNGYPERKPVGRLVPWIHESCCECRA